MEFQDIYQREYETCNRYVARACAFLMAFNVLIYLLNVMNIFVVEKNAMLLSTLISIVLLSIPGIIFLVQKKRKLFQIRYAYYSAIAILVEVGALYSILTIHVIFLYFFPVIVFAIFGNQRLLYFNLIGTVVVMFFSHVASYYFTVIPEEPFKTMGDILLFGFLPKFLVYLAFVYCFIYQTRHNNGMINRILKYSEDMYVTQEELVRAFAEMSESKSGQTGQHVKRVSQYMNVMAKELRIPLEERECLSIAAMMHDVGKLNIPVEILDKPGKLTEEEYEIIKKHTQYGYDLLKNSPGHTMEIAAVMALQHHERWDGTGYAGMKGKKIDYYSRIMAITDVFDALVSQRSYKDKWKPEEAYAEIVSQAGKQFDPELVKVFEKCYPKFVEILESLPD